MKRYTNYSDRREIIALQQAGLGYRQIAEQTIWSYETVRKVCRAYHRHGEASLHPLRMGRPVKGLLSTFDPRVRLASLRLKRQHCRWGPDMVLAEVANRPWACEVKLPSSSQLGRYFQQFTGRLGKQRPHRQLPQTKPQEAALRTPHACWQVDADERVDLPGYGLANIWNIVDYATGIKIGTFLFPARQDKRLRRVSWPQMRAALRQAFTRWGCPKRIRSDRDSVIVSDQDYPFPKYFSLWLVGLGIEHELIRKVTENGCVERSHQTWEARLDGYGPIPTLSAWQELVNYERWRMNALLPSRGRNCRRRPPLLVYPQARHSQRWFRETDEETIFDYQRVLEYLAQGQWLRPVDSAGKFYLNNQSFYLGRSFIKNWVTVTFDPQVGFSVSCPQKPDWQTTIEMKGLTVADITGLALNI